MPSAEPPTRRRRVAAVLVALAAGPGAAIVTAGCGEAAGVPVDQWRAEAEQVCLLAQAEAEALRPATGYTTAAGPSRAAAERAKTQRDDTEDLGTPDGLRRETEDYLDALDRQAEALDQLATLLLRDPTAASGPAGAAVSVANQDVDTAATALGLPGCTTQAGTATDPGAGPPPAEPGLGEGGTQES